MQLYANGDSHTAPDFSYVNLVAKEFAYNLTNQAVPGSSNASILRRTQEYLNHTTPDFIIIGWSTWEREEWYHNNRYYTVTASGTDSVPEELQDRYKQWVIEQTSEQFRVKSEEWHEHIYNFHLELDNKNIKHLFFNCIYNFGRKKQEYNWNKCYVGPYCKDLSYYSYLKDRGYQHDKWYHYEADGHEVWAQFLNNYVRENKLI